ncbi:MAG: histidine kinase, partial [Deltaproteobacteria bacterium HGW-Deltaproteobacteria-1]
MTGRILIVDDNRDNLYLLENLLKAHGFDVISVKNGKDALEKARLNPPDLIISDILMPVMDGYALCTECKSNDTLKSIPFVFYTATYTEPKDEAFALSLGAERFLLKPQEPSALMKIIKEILEETREAKQAATKPLGEEMEFFRQHNEILFKKIEKKMQDLETTNRQLQQ